MRQIHPTIGPATPGASEVRPGGISHPQAGSSADETEAVPSMFQELCRVFDASGPLKLNFADFTGFTHDVPVARLGGGERWHACDFCLFAKNHHQPGDQGWEDCVRNKQAVSRLVIHRRKGLGGMCHLGITDLVEPLIYQGRLMGAFFYGSVVVTETLEKTHRRIRHYCARRGFDPAPYFAQLRGVPRVAAADLPQYRRRLLALCAAAAGLLGLEGVVPDRYAVLLPTRDGPQPPISTLPPLVRRALAEIAGHPDHPGTLKELAARLGCHPVYLGQRFKAATGRNLNEYLLTARLDRARRMLRGTDRSIGDIAFACGFDESHFGRAFKRETGMTPQQFRRSKAASPEPPPPPGGIPAQKTPRMQAPAGIDNFNLAEFRSVVGVSANA